MSRPPVLPKILHCEAYQDGDYFVGECLELGVSSFGATLEEAKKNTNEAIDLYLQQVKKLVKKGEAVHIRPVRFYRLRLVKWTIKAFVSRRHDSGKTFVCHPGTLRYAS